MNRYIETLKETGEAMLALAKKLNSQKAQPLLPAEKRLIRHSLAPMLRRMVDEAMSPPIWSTDSFETSMEKLRSEVGRIMEDLS
jgi:hypothetical protein